MQEETMAQNEVNLRDYFDLLRRRKAIIIQTFLFVFIIGIIVAFVSRKVYRSEGRLLITQQAPTILTGDTTNPFGGLFSGSMTHNIETQIQVLYKPELLDKAYISANVSPGDARVKVDISNDKDVDIINVAVEAQSPVISAEVVNNLMQFFQAEDLDARKKDLTEAIRHAENTSQDAKRKWDDAGKALQAFRDKTKIYSHEAKIQAVTQELEQLDDDFNKIQVNIDGQMASMATTRANLAKLQPKITQRGETTNPTIAILKQQISEATTKRQTNITQFAPGHPVIIALDAQIRDLEKQLRETKPTTPTFESVDNPEILETQAQLRQQQQDIDKLKAQQASLSALKPAAQAKLKTIGDQQQKEAYLIQQRDTLQNLFLSLDTRLADLKLREQAVGSSISIMTRGVADKIPVRPKRLMIVILSALAGLFLGVCFALLQEFMDDRVHSIDDVRRLMGVPSLGLIPVIAKEDQRLLTSGNAGGSVLESYRVLRANVRFAAVGEPLQSIMVTSTVPSEGKSLTAANLAISMALDGKKVCLVDADLRRPTVHEKFGIRNTPGLTTVLVGALPLEKAIQESEVENLSILTCGPLPPNPAELLNSRAMEQLQEQLKANFDVIIFDTPPCLSVADAQVLAATVDGLIYVVQLGSTRKSGVRQGNELLRQAQAKILGVVHNKVVMDNRRGDYYGYYSYYHKAELPSKGNGNGNGNGKRRRSGSEEWEELTSKSSDSSRLTSVAVLESPTKKSDDTQAEKES